MANVPNDPRRRLFVPETFANLTPGDSLPDGAQFPMPGPVQTTFPVIHRAPCSTGFGSTTKPAPRVLNLNHSDRDLKYLLQSEGLWKTLEDYATYEHLNTFTTQSQRPQGHVYAAGAETWPLDLPPIDQMTRAIHGLREWNKSNALYRTAVAESEAAVQNIVHSRLIEPLNLITKVSALTVFSFVSL